MGKAQGRPTPRTRPLPSRCAWSGGTVRVRSGQEPISSFVLSKEKKSQGLSRALRGVRESLWGTRHNNQYAAFLGNPANVSDPSGLATLIRAETGGEHDLARTIDNETGFWLFDQTIGLIVNSGVNAVGLLGNHAANIIGITYNAVIDQADSTLAKAGFSDGNDVRELVEATELSLMSGAAGPPGQIASLALEGDAWRRLGTQIDNMGRELRRLGGRLDDFRRSVRNLSGRGQTATSLSKVKSLGAAARGFSQPDVPQSLWRRQRLGVQVRQFGDLWVKRVNPDASQFMQWWGRQTIKAQAEGLEKLGDLGTPFQMRGEMIFTRHVGTTMDKAFDRRLFFRNWYRGSLRMGTFVNDIRPRNMGANGIIFDPALDPVSKAIAAGGLSAGFGAGIGIGFIF